MALQNASLWILRAKQRVLDWPSGLCVAVIVLVCAIGIALFTWSAALGPCLPGDGRFCAAKVLTATAAWLLRREVPFDFDELPSWAFAARWLAIGAVVLALASLSLRRVQHQMNARLAAHGNDATIVFCDDVAGVLSAIGLGREHGVVAFCTQASSDLIRELADERIPYMTRLQSDFGKTSGQALSHGESLFLLERDSLRNLRNMAGAGAGADSTRDRKITVRIENFWLRRQAGLERDSSGERSNVQFVSLSSALARSALRRCPPNYSISLGRHPAPQRYWIIGTSDAALELLLLLARQQPSRFSSGATFVLAGPGSSRALTDLQRRSPFLETLVPTQAFDLRTQFPESAQDLVDAMAPPQAAPPDLVYICLEDWELARAWRTRLFTCFARHRAAPPVIEIVHGAALGRDEFCDSPGLVELSERLDAAPRRVHEAYLQARSARGEAAGAAHVPWVRLSHDLQEENRSQVDHAWIKARDAFCVIDSAEPLSNAEWLRAEDAEALAEAEHRRWMTSRAVLGWRAGPVRDDLTRIHPSLVPWSELSEPEREKDRDAVRNVAALLARVGLSLRPLTCIIVHPNHAASDDSARLAARLSALATRETSVLLLVLVTAPSVMDAVRKVARHPAIRFGWLIPADAAMTDRAPDVSSDEEIDAPRPWCVIRLHDLSLDECAARIGARIVDLSHDDEA